jgi:hypothetical protein
LFFLLVLFVYKIKFRKDKHEKASKKDQTQAPANTAGQSSTVATEYQEAVAQAGQQRLIIYLFICF